MCMRRPLIATSSLDKTVRIWNYLTKTLELIGVYPEDTLSISMHPDGKLQSRQELQMYTMSLEQVDELCF